MPIANAYTNNAYAKDARSRQGSRLSCVLGQAVVVLSEPPSFWMPPSFCFSQLQSAYTTYCACVC